jgi:hypothetical protein
MTPFRNESFLFELADFAYTELECTLLQDDELYLGGVVINIDDLMPPKDSR